MIGRQLALTLSALLAIAGSTVKADQVLGINSAASPYGGGIYSIDVDTGAATLVQSTTGVSLGNSSNSGNSLATAPNGTLYFSSYNAGTNDTLFASKAGVTTTAGGLFGNVASGTYADGSYWYIKQGSGFLNRVNFDAAGTTIISDTLIALSGDAKPWTFGDLAVMGNTMFGSGILSGGATQELFSIDMTTFKVTTIAALPVNLQLAFAGANLIGLETDTGKIYGVNTSTGALTLKSTVSSSFRFNDLSSAGPGVAPVPEPSTIAMLGLGLTFLLPARRLLAKAKRS